MKVRGARGWGCQKRHGLKLICTTGRESPPRERKLLPPQLHHGPLCRAEAKALDCRVGSGSIPPKPHFPPSLGSAQAATGGSSRQQVRSSSRSGLLPVSPLFRKAQQPWGAPPGSSSSSSRSRTLHPAASELRAAPPGSGSSDRLSCQTAPLGSRSSGDGQRRRTTPPSRSAAAAR